MSDFTLEQLLSIFFPCKWWRQIVSLEIEIDTVEEMGLFLSGGVGLCMSLLR